MLDLRPTCEHCNCALPPESASAMICSFECTFCIECVERYFGNVCPNCGGGLLARPVRPASDWRNGNSLANYPASTVVVHRPKDLAVHRELRETVESIPPEKR